MLAYDTEKRLTATQALTMPYFISEDPPMELPIGCVIAVEKFGEPQPLIPVLLPDYRLSKANGTNWRRSENGRRQGKRRKATGCPSTETASITTSAPAVQRKFQQNSCFQSSYQPLSVHTHTAASLVPSTTHGTLYIGCLVACMKTSTTSHRHAFIRRPTAECYQPDHLAPDS